MMQFLLLKEGDHLFGNKIVKVEEYYCQTTYTESGGLKEDVDKRYIRHKLWVNDLFYYVAYHDNTISEKLLSFAKVNENLLSFTKASKRMRKN